MTKIVKLADRTLVIRGMNKDRVVFDTIFTANDRLDLLELEFLGLSSDIKRNRHRYCVQNLSDFAIRCAAVGVYLTSNNAETQAAIDTAVGSVYKIAA